MHFSHDAKMTMRMLLNRLEGSKDKAFHHLGKFESYIGRRVPDSFFKNFPVFVSVTFDHITKRILTFLFCVFLSHACLLSTHSLTARLKDRIWGRNSL